MMKGFLKIYSIYFFNEIKLVDKKKGGQANGNKENFLNRIKYEENQLL